MHTTFEKHYIGGKKADMYYGAQLFNRQISNIFYLWYMTILKEHNSFFIISLSNNFQEY